MFVAFYQGNKGGPCVAGGELSFLSVIVYRNPKHGVERRVSFHNILPQIRVPRYAQPYREYTDKGTISK